MPALIFAEHYPGLDIEVDGKGHVTMTEIYFTI